MTRHAPQTFPLQPIARWTHAPRDIPPQGLSLEATATQDERAAVSKQLGLASCDALTASYTLRPSGTGNFDLTGRLSAQIVQQCVITLDPVPAKIDEILKAEFLPTAGPQDPDSDTDRKILSPVAIETITDDVIDIGRFCFEVLSSAIDPYPKTPQAKAQTEPADHTAGPQGEAGPFKDLANWKDRSKSN